MRKIRLIILFAFLWPMLAKSTDSLPFKSTDEQKTYLRIQYAGNLGLVSVGYGRHFFNDLLFVDFGYGYLPKLVNGAKVHTFALKNTCHYYRFTYKGFEGTALFGAAITYSIAPNTYIKYPDYYPEDYYMPNALHLLPFVGVSTGFPCKLNRIDKINIYSELGTVDYKLWYSFKSDYVKFSEIWNLSFGMVLHLKNN